MPIYAISAKLFVQSDADPENIGHAFEGGAAGALEGFPHGDIFSVDVENVVPLDAEEIAERGFEE